MSGSSSELKARPEPLAVLIHHELCMRPGCGHRAIDHAILYHLTGMSKRHDHREIGLFQFRDDDFPPIGICAECVCGGYQSPSGRLKSREASGAGGVVTTGEPDAHGEIVGKGCVVIDDPHSDPLCPSCGWRESSMAHASKCKARKRILRCPMCREEGGTHKENCQVLRTFQMPFIDEDILERLRAVTKPLPEICGFCGYAVDTKLHADYCRTSTATSPPPKVWCSVCQAKENEDHAGDCPFFRRRCSQCFVQLDNRDHAPGCPLGLLERGLRQPFRGSTEQASAAATPQPPPKGTGRAILRLVIKDMEARVDLELLRERGFSGRQDKSDHLKDAYQKVLDTVVYLRQEIEERDNG